MCYKATAVLGPLCIAFYAIGPELNSKAKFKDTGILTLGLNFVITSNTIESIRFVSSEIIRKCSAMVYTNYQYTYASTKCLYSPW